MNVLDELKIESLQNNHNGNGNNGSDIIMKDVRISENVANVFKRIRENQSREKKHVKRNVNNEILTKDDTTRSKLTAMVTMTTATTLLAYPLIMPSVKFYHLKFIG